MSTDSSSGKSGTLLRGAVKSDFTNVRNKIWPDMPEDKKKLFDENKKAYGKYCLAVRYVDLKSAFDSEDSKEKKTGEAGLDLIKAFIAAYADLREWGYNSDKESRNDVLNFYSGVNNNCDIEKDVERLVLQRYFVVLQGAPGCGKTFTAKNVAKTIVKKTRSEDNIKDSNTKTGKIFFTQFHAETTYSDFVYGIRPKLSSSGRKDDTATHLEYEGVAGPFVQAVQYAENHQNENVVLIVDEINRANLSNVLGEVLYLFEPTMKSTNTESEGEQKVQIRLGDRYVEALPDNFYCIATMNTADRSLAVVDFALRRRFTWYTIYPHAPEDEKLNGQLFCKYYFNKFTLIFDKYANDFELSLQPGQSYFIVDGPNEKDQMKDRLRYELMPLIKEYLDSGLLSDAKDEFEELFNKEIGESMYR